MTRDERIRFAIARFQRELRLHDWDVRHDPRWDGRKDRDASAKTVVHGDARIACVSVDPEVEGDNIDYHVAHEMAHLALWDIQRLSGNVVAKMGKPGLGVLDTLDEHIELVCNRVAHALTGLVFEPVGKRARHLYAPFAARDEVSSMQETK